MVWSPNHHLRADRTDLLRVRAVFRIFSDFGDGGGGTSLSVLRLVVLGAFSCEMSGFSAITTEVFTASTLLFFGGKAAGGVEDLRERRVGDGFLGRG